ncbi:hypothetical protein BV898_08994 [Hypsibius exemplaris]|uniref:Uncharacterized protein n=1 Tax=Hypsibius exemplaris TaxID=2072580 RepID=A0A1W0WNN0_HYPEX|nr:hypothetical protein BV898_08994 [Hypsibius exemplaris]
MLASWNQTWLTEEDFAIYAQAVVAEGGVIPNVFGFIDGTAKPICRPIHFQRPMYSPQDISGCTLRNGKQFCSLTVLYVIFMAGNEELCMIVVF